MIKVTDVIAIDAEKKEADVVLKADTKSEVTSGATIEGIPGGYTLGFNSYIFTAEGDVGLIKSDGTWSWID